MLNLMLIVRAKNKYVNNNCLNKLKLVSSTLRIMLQIKKQFAQIVRNS
jgi:hypothetical protein